MSSAERNERLDRMYLSLDGLSVGDAFGERYFGTNEDAVARIRSRSLSPQPWKWTDDTEMAISIVEMLDEDGSIDRDELARRFASRMHPDRGYGANAYGVLTEVARGVDWRAASASGFKGMGSFGNGGAMRVAPLGAWFADDLPRAAREATASAEVTHSHPEGVAGAISVAIATAIAWRDRAKPFMRDAFLSEVAAATPKGYTRDGIEQARKLPAGATVAHAASELGNGSGVTSPDTVPFCLWAVGTHPDDYEAAMWATVSALGDRDTTCAIVGGILAVRIGAKGIPSRWLSAREPLPVHR